MEIGARRHVVIVTVPCPGHIIPATQVARYLLSRGVLVSRFTTGMNYPRLEQHLVDSFRGERIPFLPLISASEFVSPGKEITDNIRWMQAPSDWEMATRLEKAMQAIGTPPQCIVSDLLAGWTQDVADGRGIERHVLYTMPANALLFSFGCIPSVLSPEVAPVHPPGTWNSMIDTTHSFHDYLIRNTKRMPEASIILVNTFEALEAKFLDLLQTGLIGNPTVKIESILSIGPLIRNAGRELEESSVITTNKLPSSKISGDEACVEKEVMQWLDAQEQSTVLYVSFGSLLTVPEVQIHELAHGLEESGRPFLWVYRAPSAPQVLPSDADGALLDGLPAGAVPSEGLCGNHGTPIVCLNSLQPCLLNWSGEITKEFMVSGFVERVAGRGKLIHGWAPQEALLAHSSVGGFLSHCGWNSTLEALWAGKPIAAWPLAVEQRLTARYLANDLRIAVEVRKDDAGLVARSEVLRTISMLMNDQEMRRRFGNMHQQAHSTLRESGSSRSNLQILVDRIGRHNPS